MRALQDLTWRHWVAGLLFILGIGMVALLGFRAASDTPPSAAEGALFVVLAGVLQLGSASTLHSIGKADPGLARASVRRLLQMAKRAAQAGAHAQQAFEKGTSEELRDAMGIISVHLSYLQEDVLAVVEDWSEFHSVALRQLIEEASDDGSD